MIVEKPQNLDGVIKDFTLCLEDPCIPGELEIWIKAVWQALEKVRPVLQQHIARNHQELFARIVEEDTELFRQVALLKKEDQNILHALESLAERTRKLLEKAPRVEPNEAQVHEEVSVLIRDGLAFMVQIQRQEIAIRTWVQEAFLRERGVAD
jgi:hypothetical protein